MADKTLDPDRMDPRKPISMLIPTNSIKLSVMLMPLKNARKNITTNRIGINARIILTQGMPFFSFVTLKSANGGNVSGLSRYLFIPGLCPAPTTATTFS